MIKITIQWKTTSMNATSNKYVSSSLWIDLARLWIIFIFVREKVRLAVLPLTGHVHFMLHLQRVGLFAEELDMSTSCCIYRRLGYLLRKRSVHYVARAMRLPNPIFLVRGTRSFWRLFGILIIFSYTNAEAPQNLQHRWTQLEPQRCTISRVCSLFNMNFCTTL